MKKQYYHKGKCKDCSALIDVRAIRCSKCNYIWLKRNHKPQKYYRWNKNKHCLCGKKISNVAISCLSCAIKINSPKKWSLSLRLKVSGKNHWNWKNGITGLNRLIRKLILYKEWRNKIFERDDYTCQLCHQKKKYFEPHHKIPLNIIVALYKIKNIREAIKCTLLWDINWGTTLCKKCHADIHERNYKI